MVTMALAAASASRRVRVTNSCGSLVWSMMPKASSPTGQTERKWVPLIFMARAQAQLSSPASAPRKGRVREGDPGIATGFVRSAWVPFPSRCRRNAQPGMTIVFSWLGRRRGFHGRILAEFLVPTRQIGMGSLPIKVGQAKRDIAQGTGHRDFPDGGVLGEFHLFQRAQSGGDGCLAAGDAIRIAALLGLRQFIPPGDSGIGDTIAQRLKSQRFPASAIVLPD